MESQETSEKKPFGEADSPTGSGDDSSHTTESILRRLSLLTDQVDALQVESARGGRPWWREPSLMISAVALVISVLFSAIGMRQVAAKDIAAKQEALRQTMVQIVEGQTEASKAAQENIGNPLMARWASANLNTKRQVQIDTALALVNELGDRVDASTLTPLAGQLQIDGRYEESLSLYFKALDLAQSPIVRSAVLRSIGWSYRILGSSMYDLDKSRDYLQRAVDLFKNQDDDASRFYMADDLLFWAELELADGQAERAGSLFEQATSAAEAMSAANPSRQVLLSQIQQAESSQTTASQAVPDLRGEWQLRFAGDSSKHGNARIMVDQASGTYYLSMLVLRDDVVLESRSGTGTTPDPSTLLIQWQGTRYSEQYQVPVQASGVLELDILPGGQELSGTDSAVGDQQQIISLTRASP
jgi:tetratricopeptide (TPR) repeat protein